VRPPDQPVERDKEGVLRFRENKIVRYLLDCGRFDMNDIAMMPFAREDRVQFAQLIGYSVSGFSELPYVDDADWDRAEAATEKAKKVKV